MANKVQRRLQGFTQHGFIQETELEDHAVGMCPFCAARKFYISLVNPVWDCKVCGLSGNYEQFLHLRMEMYQKDFKGVAATRLARDRGVSVMTLRAFGVGLHNQEYFIPVDGNGPRILTNIKRFRIGSKCISTSGCKLSFVVPKTLVGSSTVLLAEGEWDGMALWEAISEKKKGWDVYIAPGASVAPNRLLGAFQDKDVLICYDNDSAGAKGTIKMSEILHGIARQVSYIAWTDDKPNGYDVRDLFKESKSFLTELLGMESTDFTSLADRHHVHTVEANTSLDPLTGSGLDPDEVFKRYQKWLVIKEREPLDILFGAVFANRLEGEPVWLFMVAPPSGMKSELLMSISKAPRIYPITSFTPKTLMSGATTASGDPSLLPRLNGKVLVVKDFTALMKMNPVSRDEILGLLRDIYDGSASREFGSGVIRTYESQFGIISGVTQEIETLRNTTTLGERFLRYRLDRRIGSADEMEITRKAIRNNRTNNSMRLDLIKIGTETLNREVSVEDLPPMTEETILKLSLLGKWISRMRGSVSKEQYSGIVRYQPKTESPARLAKQLHSIMDGICLFKGETQEVSGETFQAIMHVAQDTAPNLPEIVVRNLYQNDCEMSTKQIAEWLSLPSKTVKDVLDDLNMLGNVKKVLSGPDHWTLSREMRDLTKETGIYESDAKWFRGIRDAQNAITE